MDHGQEQQQACLDSALRLLSRREHAVAELERKLRQRRFSRDDIEWVTSELCRTGLLNDVRFAGLYAEERLRTTRAGTVRIVRELRRRGVDRPTAERAVREAADELGEDDAERVLEAARRKWPACSRLPREKARARLWRHLQRQGFPAELCRRALDSVDTS